MPENSQPPARRKGGVMKPIISGLARPWRRLLPAATAILAGAWLAVGPLAPAAVAAPVTPAVAAVAPSTTGGAFGPNVYVFSPAMSQTSIQSTLDSIASQQVSNQFGAQRYAILFEPGTYGSSADPLIFQVGYYTTVAGLGLDPGGVVINGSIDVYNQCFATNNCIALDNFWRSLSNLTINVAGGAGCQAATDFWAVSQAAPLRRVDINGKLSLMDYCNGSPDYASGGFIADSQFTGSTVVNGSQQQWVTRNSNLDGWSNGVWNQVFCGDPGAPAQSFGVAGANPYTTLATCPATEEEPFLYTDSQGKYRRLRSRGPAQFVRPGLGQRDRSRAPPSRCRSSSWPARDTSVLAIDVALALGKDLILTPGVYDLDQPILVSRPDTVVLGLGMATLVPQHGNAAMIVVPNNGVKLSGLIIDAGPVNSPVLLSVGMPGPGNASDPDLIQDVFFRIGGAETTPVSATVSLLDNASNSIIDDLWAWRADHGNAVGWTVNTGRHRRRRHRQQRHRLRPGRGALPEERGDLERPGRHGHLLPERDCPTTRPASPPGWPTRAQDGYPSFQVSQQTSRASRATGWAATSSSARAWPFTTTRPSRRRICRVSSSTTYSPCTWTARAAIKSIINGIGAPSSTATPGTPVDVTSYP